MFSFLWIKADDFGIFTHLREQCGQAATPLSHQSLNTWKGDSAKINESLCCLQCVAHTMRSYGFETKHFMEAISFLSAACTLYCLRDTLPKEYFLAVCVVVATRPQRMKRCFRMIGAVVCEGITGSLAFYCHSFPLCVRFYSPSKEVAFESVFRDIKCTCGSYTSYKPSQDEDKSCLGVAYHTCMIVTLTWKSLHQF